ncbi:MULTISPECIES: 5'-deoxynucleotidase [unclassified Oleiphilus]|jgi:5'-deoxynucleotidase|uniref:5'-deoxynucleotidase n=1 Tax=unclassified Oleiphilus TaxID=2631174 RepID=UPI0007C36AFA|nr:MULTISPECIES: 5'-deoxynucleotidase [unclassified Oleiphilus]KZY42868.1 5'-deoxynucleotidase [Oleiphilus sp. HI0050]KZY77605.1 5'-deoxynucleotidase [Oleiphilus sp. HI0068]KZY85284.1 5'-deoxynucleotidase [Oleiphilus sp. HI0069]KZY86970.1 5'-deoxynucleotidase [Oleiphilus sp. HI0072]KZZ11210.1 5'-deoxynucleotidase [Oleiphilus sp. HI0078]KZZ26749.1 5'-deoxynucleotidase [Oleiphilus sp. HI0081]
MHKTISHFFAYVSRLKWIKRWSLMRNAIHEDVAVHSWEVATIAHILAIIHNKDCDLNNKIDANHLAVVALYHDATEVITGDMPTPVKYHSEAMRTAYKGVEEKAQHELLALLPASLHQDFSSILLEDTLPEHYLVLLKAADRLSALLKCRAELRAGNREFEQAEQEISSRLNDMNLAPVHYFLEVFAPGYDMSLDNLLDA